MRRAAWAAIGLAVLSVLLGLTGRAARSDALYLLSGLSFLTALGLAVSLLPVWQELGLRLPPMRGLFPPVATGQRWCTVCGRASGPGTCVSCGAPDGRRPRKARKPRMRVGP